MKDVQTFGVGRKLETLAWRLYND